MVEAVDGLRSHVVTPELSFTGPGHDRAADRRTDDEWLRNAWASSSTRVLTVVGGAAEVRSEALAWRDPASSAKEGERYLLGVDDEGCARFAVRLDDVPVDAEVRGLRQLAASLPPAESGWACHAVALSQWHAAHPHCSRCGARTVVTAGGSERRCPEDGSAHFPRVDPAVIMLVTDAQDRALLGRHASWPVGRFSTLAGFVEPGETAEQAVCREVAEESGLAVTDVQLLGTQPWPFPSSLMIGASARVAGIVEPHPDGAELVEARWFSRDGLRDAVASGEVQVSGAISISRWLIDRWYGGALPDDGAGWR